MHRLRRLVRDERGDVSIDNVRRERDAATVQGGFGAVAVLCLAQFVDVLGVTSALTALPRMLHGVGASPSSAALVATAYAMMFGGLLILGARAGDTYGAREGHHGVFVFRYGGKAARRQFDDPGTAHAAGRNGQPPRGFHHPGKLELYARK